MHFSEPFFPSACPALEKKKKKKRNLKYRRIPSSRDLNHQSGREKTEKGRNRTKRFIRYTLRKEFPCVSL